MNTVKIKGLTKQEAVIFEWQYGFCGSFKKALWEAICHAPVEISAYRWYAYEKDWWRKVQNKIDKLGIDFVKLDILRLIIGDSDIISQ